MSYPDVVAQILPAYAVKKRLNRAFQYLDQGNIVEAFDPQAVSALRAGVAKYWYPHYLATVVIAVDRDRTNANINSWSDLPNTIDEVGISSAISSHPVVSNQMILSAIAFGLEGENYTLKRAAELLVVLRAEKRLVVNSLDQSVMICYDFQAADLIKNGRNIEVIVPREGTLTYEKGLLSNTELVFSDDVNNLLLAGGFRLSDGRCDPALYPDASAYANAFKVADYGYFIDTSQNTTRILRQDVLRVKLLASKDDRQHQWLVLVYIIIVTVWTASFVRRIAHKNMSNTVLMTVILLLGWAFTRLISYQLDVNTDFRRYLGYTYYVFQLSLPVTLSWLAFITDKQEGKISAPWWMKVFAAYMFTLIVLVYTNDLHNSMYVYDFLNENWGNENGYGIIYSIVQKSWQISFAAVFVILLFKSRGSIRKKSLLLPLLFIVLLSAYQYGYEYGIPIAREGDWTIMNGIFTLLFVESLVWAGMVPVNTKYRTLFNHTPLGMRIIDKSGNPALSSAAAIPFDKDLFTCALEIKPMPVQQGEDSLLFVSQISGGYALWQEDISSLNRLQKEIEESVARLKAANVVLAEEAKIRQSAEEAVARTQLMEQLESEITGHTIKLSAMIGELLTKDKSENSSGQPKALVPVALLLCYIKRRCNLFFREKEAETLPADELTAYFSELSDIAFFSGIKTIVTNELKTQPTVRRATLLYDFYYSVIFWAVNDMVTLNESRHILAHLLSENGNTVLRLLPSGKAHSFKMDNDLEKSIASSGGIFNIKDLDDAFGLSLSFAGGKSNA